MLEYFGSGGMIVCSVRPAATSESEREQNKVRGYGSVCSKLSAERKSDFYRWE